MIQQITTSNMKLFQHVDVRDLQRFNLLVGKNNCGKSTMLEALFLIIAPANTALPVRLAGFRGMDLTQEGFWKQFFHKLDTSLKINITARVQAADETEERVLDITPLYAEAELTKDQKALEVSTAQPHKFETITGLKYRYMRVTDKGEQQTYNDLKVTSKDGMPAGTMPKDYEERLSGSFLSPATLYWDMLRRLSKLLVGKRMEELMRILKRVDASINDIVIGENNRVYCDIGLDNYIPLQSMGAGFIQVLSTLLAVYESKDNVLLIDEIENGLHHTTLSWLWRGIIEAAYQLNVQIFASTHSMECVRAYHDVASENLLYHKDYRLYRLERQADLINVVGLDLENVQVALESDWEIR